ncbi:hypothetical protein EYF80_020779 [Liparis tanakae]|uniref:Uncharacterized protein n=1 Tax=Liparis tanakae TaxID=230148 RepID=A0A4Z2HT35_9TELE|nr:hypothetical protein EYF80_020779 [Liparis tanakae]
MRGGPGGRKKKKKIEKLLVSGLTRGENLRLFVDTSETSRSSRRRLDGEFRDWTEQVFGPPVGAAESVSSLKQHGVEQRVLHDGMTPNKTCARQRQNITNYYDGYNTNPGRAAWRSAVQRSSPSLVGVAVSSEGVSTGAISLCQAVG